MRILLDHCLPRRLKNYFPSHTVATASDQGWEDLQNGELLAAAAKEFDLFLTIDKNLKHEQNPATLPIAVLVILAPTNRIADVLPFAPAVEKAIGSLKPKVLVEVSVV